MITEYKRIDNHLADETDKDIEFNRQLNEFDEDMRAQFNYAHIRFHKYLVAKGVLRLYSEAILR